MYPILPEVNSINNKMGLHMCTFEPIHMRYLCIDLTQGLQKHIANILNVTLYCQ